MEDLTELSRVDGADRARAADAFTDPLRNGDSNGELGIVIQMDVALRAAIEG